MAVPLADAALSRLLGAPRPRNSYTVEAVRVPMRDGVLLTADHFVPVTPRPRGTVLIRTPYGRGFPTSSLNGRMFAARGYHVVIQSVRGTFGSGGTFEPMAQETDDGLDTVAWLRTQPWFDGRLATAGGSYLGWAQWTMLQDPPPEIKTAIVYVGPHDFREAVFGRGPFTLGDFLSWTSMITTQEEGGLLRRVYRGATADRRLAPIMGGLPLPEAAEPELRGRAPWYRTWLSHPDAGDPWWTPYRAGAALQRVEVPVLLVGGWQDLFLDQTLEQYFTLRERGVEVAMTVGPWTHLDVGTKGAAQINRESLTWLDTHLAGDGPVRQEPVRVYRTGEGKWHGLASWPPPTSRTSFALTGDGGLVANIPGQPSTAGRPWETSVVEPSASAHPWEASAAEQSAADRPPDASAAEQSAAGRPWEASAAEQSAADRPSGASAAAVVSFRYDPTDPTPSVGGRTLSGSMGIKDNRALEARQDVVTFTSAPLATAIDVTGRPSVTLAVAVDNPHADVFVRLCDVDERGRSRNFSDRLTRLDPRVPAGTVQQLALALDPCFHRLLPGHRLRLQIAGGAFPRYARNLGTAGTPAEGRTLKPSRHDIYTEGCHITLPDSHSVPSSSHSTTTTEQSARDIPVTPEAAAPVPAPRTDSGTGEGAATPDAAPASEPTQ
jgi:putative CocE/NonD family hydrolase